MKLTFYKILLNTVSLLKKIPENYMVIVCYATILTLLSFASGLLPSCQLGREGGWWCYMENSNGTFPLYLFVLNKFLFFVICCLFFIDFYNSAFNGKVFRFKEFADFNKPRLKVLLFLILSFVLLLGSVAAVFAIMLKQANPDWRIEFIYFVAAFICCWIPFILLRISSAISYLASGECPPLRLIWQKTSDRNFHIIFSFIVIFIVINFVSLYINAILKFIMLKSFNVATSLAADFIYNGFTLIYISLFMMLFRAMHEILASENLSPSDKLVTMDSQKNDTALPEAENDNSRVKKSAKKTKAVKSRKNKKEKK